MAEQADEAQYHEARFLALISGLAGNAMQHLGKVMNPLTGQIERNLELARETIDLLRMLREKTKGNLSDREKRSLDALLSSLQLNYVDEARADAQKAKEEPKERPPEATEAQESTKPRKMTSNLRPVRLMKLRPSERMVSTRGWS